MLASHPSPSLLASRWLSRLWRSALGLEHSFRTLRQHVAFYCRQIRPAPEQAIPAPFDGDLLAWSKHFLPHYFQAPPSKMHREVAAILDSHSIDPSGVAAISPGSRSAPGVSDRLNPTDPGRVAASSPIETCWHPAGMQNDVVNPDDRGCRSAQPPANRCDPSGIAPNDAHNSALPAPNSELSPHSALDGQPRGREAAAGEMVANCMPPSPADSRPLESFIASPLASISEHQRLTSPLKLNVLAPRASAKSTLVTLSYALREAIEGRQPYIWIVSDTRHQAISHLENLSAELADNDVLQGYYPHAADVVSRSGRITLPTGVQIEAFGAGQRLRGKRYRQHRPSLIICDDLQNDSHMVSARQRDRSRSWFHSMLLKAGTKDTQVVNLGTALHREAIAIQLADTPGWTSRRFQAIEHWPTRMEMWARWEEMQRQESGIGGQESGRQLEPNGVARSEPAKGVAEVPNDLAAQPRPSLRQSVPPNSDGAHLDGHLPTTSADGSRSEPATTHSALPTPNSALAPSFPIPHSAFPISPALDFYQQNRDEMHTGASLLWPEVEDLYTLMTMRAESGPAAFEREKQCVPLNPEECEWPESYFSDDIWFDRWPEEVQVKAIALDPSKGTDSRHGDYSAFVMLAIAKDGTLFVDANLARRPTPQIVTDGVDLIERFQPQGFGVEANQFQSLLAVEFRREFQRRQMIHNPYTITNQLAKAVRIRTLGSLLAARRFRFKSNSPGCKLLVEQLREFPLAKHDDGPDALEMSLGLAQQLLEPKRSDGLGKSMLWF